jgi:hypothetical protein
VYLVWTNWERKGRTETNVGCGKWGLTYMADCGEYKIATYPLAILQNILNIYTGRESLHIHPHI